MSTIVPLPDGQNILVGTAGNDSIDSTFTLFHDIRLEEARLIGLGGNDAYVVAGDLHRVLEDAGGGTDEVRSLSSYTLPDNVENLVLLGDAETGVGNALGNVITGNAGGNALFGGAGNDRLVGGAGDDVLGSPSGFSKVLPLPDLGNDTMDGGAGDDEYHVDSTADVAIETLSGEAGGHDIVFSGATFTLGANLEDLFLQGGAAINGTGNAGNNLIEGGFGNNVLTGLAGADNIDGGPGNDTLDGGEGDDIVAGGEGNDSVGGGGGSDSLGGNLGRDTLAGGAGDDFYFLIDDEAPDTVVEQAGQGTDAVIVGASYALPANVEDLQLLGGEDLNGTGNPLNNALRGNAGNNRLNGDAGDDLLDGRGGHDTMLGGPGNDTYVVDSEGDRVIEVAGAGTDLVVSSILFTALPANVENLTLVGPGPFTGEAANARGNALGNLMVGNGTSNLLFGLDGNDTLDGRNGADTLFGGRGDDTYIVETQGDQVYELAGEGNDTIRSAIGFGLPGHIETLILTGTDDIFANGTFQPETLIGNPGSNVLMGRLGNDTMAGGPGNDSYWVEDAGDVVTEAASAGTDLVNSTIFAYTLPANVENLTLQPGGGYSGSLALNGTGNTLPNAITGNEFANVLTGLDGGDSLTGGMGNDTLDGGGGNDTLDGGPQQDEMRGGPGDDVYVNVGPGDGAGTVLTGTQEDQVIELAGGGTDRVISITYTWTLGPNTENLDLAMSAYRGIGNELPNVIRGTDRPNHLMGMGGNDTLDGGGGIDRMEGGPGDDTYFVDDQNDLVAEIPGAGTDTVRTSVDYALPTDAAVENAVFTGSGFASLRGNGAPNQLTGHDGDDDLFGERGNDTLIGNGGNDFLDGGAGNDNLQGGPGNDTYRVDVVGDLVTEAANAGTDVVFSEVSYALTAAGTLNVEGVILAGPGPLAATGNALNNLLVGNDGANTLDGGAGNDLLDGEEGADLLRGGTGNDFYGVHDGDGALNVIVAGEDRIEELAAGGTDTASVDYAVSGSDSFRLPDNVENLIVEAGTTGPFSPPLLHGFGNATANTIMAFDLRPAIGTAQAFDLRGEAGNDTFLLPLFDGNGTQVSGGDGTDTAFVVLESFVGTATLASIERVEIATHDNGSVWNGFGFAGPVGITGNAGLELGGLQQGAAFSASAFSGSQLTFHFANTGGGNDRLDLAVHRVTTQLTTTAGIEQVYLTTRADAVPADVSAPQAVLDGIHAIVDPFFAVLGPDPDPEFTEQLAAMQDMVDAFAFDPGPGASTIDMSGVPAVAVISVTGNSGLTLTGLPDATASVVVTDYVSGNLSLQLANPAAPGQLVTLFVHDAFTSLDTSAGLETLAIHSVADDTSGLRSVLNMSGVDPGTQVVLAGGQTVVPGGATLPHAVNLQGLATHLDASDYLGNLTANAAVGGLTIEAGSGVNIIRTQTGPDVILFEDRLGLDDQVIDSATGDGDGLHATLVNGPTVNLPVMLPSGLPGLVEVTNAYAPEASNIENFFFTTSGQAAVIDAAAITGTGITFHFSGSAPVLLDFTRDLPGFTLDGVGYGGQLTVNGSNGNDVLASGNGSDQLNGGRGDDVLRGGLGPDSFMFTTPLEVNGVDEIQDFTAIDDTIVLARSWYAEIGPAGGPMDPTRFYAFDSSIAPPTPDADDRVLYDLDHGHLYYDADGSGPSEAVLFAQVTGTLDSADIHVGV